MFDNLDPVQTPATDSAQRSSMVSTKALPCPPDTHRQWIPLLVAVLLPLGALMGILVFVNTFIHPFFTSSSTQKNTSLEQRTTESTNTTNEQKPFDEGSDEDADGLSTQTENRMQTASNRFDTDEDGLGDGEEINTYGTNPLNPDTDRDGYPDGVEVETGHNPLISGE